MAKKRVSTRLVLLPVPVERVERQIYLIRGHKVMVDTDLAALYRVATANLNKAVKRNMERFPDDFMFQLTEEEAKNLRFQIGISSGHHGGRRYLPYVFTEHGVAMLSSVVHSPRAVQVNILIVRAFIRLRQLLATHQDLARRIEEIERLQKKQGRRLRGICSVVMHLIDVPSKPKASFGFKS